MKFVYFCGTSNISLHLKALQCSWPHSSSPKFIETPGPMHFFSTLTKFCIYWQKVILPHKRISSLSPAFIFVDTVGSDDWAQSFHSDWPIFYTYLISFYFERICITRNTGRSRAPISRRSKFTFVSINFSFEFRWILH